MAMARKHLILLSFAMVALLVSCATSGNLVVQEELGVQMSTSRGEATACVTNDGIEYRITGNSVEGGEGSFIVSITNTTSKPFEFKDSDISILRSNYKWGFWKTIGTWDAKAYYSNAAGEVRSGAFLAGLAGVMWRVDAILGIIASRDSHYSRQYDFGDYMAGELIARAAIDSARGSGEDYLKFLEENLLFSSTIAPGETYTGWVFFDAPRYDYYKVEITSSGRKRPLSVTMLRDESF